MQIIGKTKSRENIPFLEQMRHIQHASVPLRLLNTSGFITHQTGAAISASRLMPNKPRGH